MLKNLPWLIAGLLVLANAAIFYKIRQVTLLPSSEITHIASSANSSKTNSGYIFPQQTLPAEVDTFPNKKISHFVPILMYHYIRDYTDQNDQLGIQLSVSPTLFKKQLETIKNAGYQTITLSDFLDGKYGTKPIILTFDDGYDDHYTQAFPVLKQEGMVGTFFIISGFVNEPMYLTVAQIAEMKTAGMEMGGHTFDHKNLATMSDALAYEEIRLGQVGRDPVFAYPSGQYNQNTVGLVKELGVKTAVTTVLGVATDISDPELLPRIRIKSGTDILKVINEQEYLLLHPLTSLAPPQ